VLPSSSGRWSPVNFYQTTRRKTPEDSHLHNLLSIDLLSCSKDISRPLCVLPNNRPCHYIVLNVRTHSGLSMLYKKSTSLIATNGLITYHDTTKPACLINSFHISWCHAFLFLFQFKKLIHLLGGLPLPIHPTTLSHVFMYLEFIILYWWFCQPDIYIRTCVELFICNFSLARVSFWFFRGTEV
jgi:hypothetical protein